MLDFYCTEGRLAVEVDGQAHMDPDVAAKDAIRTDWLRERGVAVLRVSAEEVRTNLDGVLTWIRTNAEDRVRG